MPNNKNEEVKGENKKNTKSMILKISLSVVILVVGAASIVGFVSASQEKGMRIVVDVETIYPNIYINDIPVGGLTKEKAMEELKTNIQKVSDNKKIVLINNDNKFDFYFSDFGVNYNLQKSVDEAYLYAREGSLKERYNKIIDLDTTNYNITLESDYKKDSVEDVISSVSEEVYIEPKNPTLSRQNGVFTITEGATGLQMDSSSTASEVHKLLDLRSEGELPVVLVVVEPKYKPEDLEKAQTLIGSYSTSYSGAPTLGRVVNMQVAASHINDYTLYPNEIFSTNVAFGPSTYENGYKDAPEIVGGELVEGIGGGVCQVSSTLYNALLYSELAIVERTNHSLKVGYADWGFDATLAGDYIDLKFKNDTEYPVFVESYLANNKVVVNIYGNEIHEEGRRLEFSNELIETNNAPADKIKNDPTIPKGQKVVKVASKPGYKYNVYKTVYQGNNLVEKVKVNTSNYRPRAAQILVGTGTPAQIQAEQPQQPVATPQPVQPQPVAPPPVTPQPEQAQPSQEQPVIQEAATQTSNQ